MPDVAKLGRFLYRNAGLACLATTFTTPVTPWMLGSFQDLHGVDLNVVGPLTNRLQPGVPNLRPMINEIMGSSPGPLADSVLASESRRCLSSRLSGSHNGAR